MNVKNTLTAGRKGGGEGGSNHSWHKRIERTVRATLHSIDMNPCPMERAIGSGDHPWDGGGGGQLWLLAAPLTA